MNTCGTCRHWGSGKKNYGAVSVDDMFKPCGAVIHTDDDNLLFVTESDNSKLSEETQAEIAAVRARKAVVVDGSNYYAALKVREDFGCVLW